MDYYFNEFEVLDYLQKLGIQFSLAWLRKCRSKKTGIPAVKIMGKVRYLQHDIDLWVSNQSNGRAIMR